MIASSERAEHSTRVRGVLAEMPEPLYRRLSFPQQTADLCLTTVERALRLRNVRLVWEWIDYERSTSDEQALIACVDLAVNTAVGGTIDRETLQLSERIRSEVRDYVGAQSRRSRTDVRVREIEPVVDGILIALHAFDPSLHDHGIVVGKLARRLGEALDLSEDTCASLDVAGRVHEIGKLRVSRDLYVKPLPLTRTELQTVRGQIRDGFEMLRSHPVLAGITAIVEGANDVEAGTTAGDIECRILAVADVFHTMLIARPYRQARTPQEAFDTLQSEPSRFERSVVDALANMLGYHGQVAQSA
jgi:HD-GYP domain-containing protein (c-di-GMP phosphodiesterase class II)